MSPTDFTIQYTLPSSEPTHISNHLAKLTQFLQEEKVVDLNIEDSQDYYELMRQGNKLLDEAIEAVEITVHRCEVCNRLSSEIEDCINPKCPFKGQPS